MRKATFIGRCLVDAHFAETVSEGERVVEAIFREEFPDREFSVWNGEFPSETADPIVRAAKGATWINVREFIEALS